MDEILNSDFVFLGTSEVSGNADVFIFFLGLFHKNLAAKLIKKNLWRRKYVRGAILRTIEAKVEGGEIAVRSVRIILH